tara:strand:+ start:570 stop:746 length:177 start_codon:yes stop_codon:yes gene_type:complete
MPNKLFDKKSKHNVKNGEPADASHLYTNGFIKIGKNGKYWKVKENKDKTSSRWIQYNF